MKLSFVLLFYFVASVAFAGGVSGSGGNGGDGIVCTDKKGHVTSVELLEVFEAREVFGFHLRPSAFGVAPSTFYEMATSTSALAKFDLDRLIGMSQSWYEYQLYGESRLGWIEWFLFRRVEFTFLDQVEVDPFEHDPSLIPPNCHVRRLAQTIVADDGKRVTQFDYAILTYLSPSEFSALLFHESLQTGSYLLPSTLVRQHVIYSLAPDKLRKELKDWVESTFAFPMDMPWNVFCQEKCRVK